MASSSNNLQDWIQKKIGLSSGLTDINGLPAHLGAVMKVISEPKEMPYKQLCKILGELPEGISLAQSQLDDALYELIRMGYLASFMENGDVVYMVQIEHDKAPPPPRHEQRLLRKLDLNNLNFDDLGDLTNDDPNP